MVLQTKRLLLRPFLEADAPQIYLLARDPRIGCAAGWQPHKSVEESRLIIRHILSAEGTFAVVDRQSGKVMGSIGSFLSGNRIKGDADHGVPLVLL